MPTHFDSVRVPGLLPRITINTSPSDYRTIKQMPLYRFDGTRWAPIGGLISE
jgi:branched-chain amino acid transport system substrate-binding protein